MGLSLRLRLGHSFSNTAEGSSGRWEHQGSSESTSFTAFRSLFKLPSLPFAGIDDNNLPHQPSTEGEVAQRKFVFFFFCFLINGSDSLDIMFNFLFACAKI
ncbi:hypothetical protein AAZX31_20G201800 [Glycine max]